MIFKSLGRDKRTIKVTCGARGRARRLIGWFDPGNSDDFLFYFENGSNVTDGPSVVHYGWVDRVDGNLFAAHYETCKEQVRKWIPEFELSVDEAVSVSYEIKKEHVGRRISNYRNKDHGNL